MAADYHPLRIRRTLPAAGHLLDLEARAAGRGCEADPSAVSDLVSRIGDLLALSGRADASRVALVAPEEALRLSKALQWARAGSRILSTPAGSLPGKPRLGSLRVGGIALPAPCLYVAFDDAFPTPRAGFSVEGVYLGEGGRNEAVAAGWTEYVWALPIVRNDEATSVGSAEFSPRCLLRTDDPSILVRTSVLRSLSARRELLSGRGIERSGFADDAWHETFADAVELALQAAAHSRLSRSAGPSRKARPKPLDAGLDLDGCDEAPVVSEVVVVEATPGKDMASYLLGPEPPRVSHRWPRPEDAASPGEPETDAEPGQSSGTRNGPEAVAGHIRLEHTRTYHAGTPQERTITIAEIRVNGGPGTLLPNEIKVTHLDTRRRRIRPTKERGGQVRQSMSIVSKEQA